MDLNPIRGGVLVFHHSSFSAKSFSDKSWRFDRQASLPIELPVGGGYQSVSRRGFTAVRQRHVTHCDVLLNLRCSIRSAATLRLGANAAVDWQISLKSQAALCLGANAEINAMPRIDSIAEVNDVVLEMMMYDA